MASITGRESSSSTSVWRFSRFVRIGGGFLALSARTGVLLAILPAGCGVDPPRDPPFRMGGVRINASEHERGELTIPSPIITLCEPSVPARVDPRAKIKCLVRVDLPPSGELPAFLQVGFIKRGRIVGNFELRPKERNGQSHFFEGFVKAPRQVGKYTLRVDAIYLVGKSGPGQDTKNIVVSMTGPSIEVRRK